MHHAQANNPLHGITLETILTQLVERLGWEEMGRIIDIRCFNYDPSIKSSLQFLRRTPWARAKVETLYLTRVALAQRKGSAAPEAQQRSTGASILGKTHGIARP